MAERTLVAAAARVLLVAAALGTLTCGFACEWKQPSEPAGQREAAPVRAEPKAGGPQAPADEATAETSASPMAEQGHWDATSAATPETTDESAAP